MPPLLSSSVDAHLVGHPRLATETMTKLTRRLQPVEHCSPLEIRVFTATTDGGADESIQTDVFDHLIAMIGEFGLRLHQSPTGSDIGTLAGGRG